MEVNSSYEVSQRMLPRVGHNQLFLNLKLLFIYGDNFLNDVPSPFGSYCAQSCISLLCIELVPECQIHI